jgi:apolipoprotein N-acyltransferase
MISKIKPAYFLLIGIITIPMAHMTVSIDLAGWICCVPFLLYLQLSSGYKSRLLFFLGLVVSWSFCIAKIITPPIPAALIFLFSVPISLFHLPGYLIWDKFKNQPWSVFLFPSIMMLMEYIQYTFTPFASWGFAAYTQAHTLTMMQSLSLFGMPGLSFLIYWVNISIAMILIQKKTTALTLQWPVCIIGFLLLFGSLRYELSKANGKDTIKLAAIGTDSDVTGYPLPSKEVNDKVKENLFNRTALAAQNGAKLVVWNEASTYIMDAEENAWSDSLSALSKRLQVALVAAYIIPISEAPMKYKNKYLFFDSTGNLAISYNKHQPVPGEPADNGTEALQVTAISGTKTGAVICYDYDFPYLAKGYGELNADLVAVPSSDWRGIDPLHSRMAAFRAVEQGHSIMRSTRFGLSAAISPYGEFVSQMSSFDHNDKVMMAHLPAKKISTIYSYTGDWFVFVCIGFVVYFLIDHLRNRKLKSDAE